ncbi:hypothetical protein [Clostridium sp. CCUG 7971]|uniref:hypothetical protein n=1 Tax=Clostridium sp. CCUG 7971 TaxID=2811414 RepID=UPI001ABA4F7E|nr:hypothetical protein [Clostridium sp. CCUG 7971]MBO3444902.1 hypothetical protein [Clostridium sp. CCUG 7971]
MELGRWVYFYFQQIGVVEVNIKGRKFWDSLGYQHVKSTTINMGNKENNIYILRLIFK